MELGWMMLIVLSVMGGIIAFIGDKIGTRMGKRRVVLFGLRPRYTSILITIITGISIAIVTLGVMSVLSANARTALFGMHQLEMQKAELEAQRDKLRSQAEELGQEMNDKNELLAKNEELLANQQRQLDDMDQEVRVAVSDLDQAKAARDDMRQQLTIVQVALDESKADLTKTQEQNQALQEQNQTLQETNKILDNRVKVQSEVLQNVREGQILFRVGEVLSASVLDGGQDDEKTREALNRFLGQTNASIRQHLGIKDEKAVLLYVSQDEFEAVNNQLKNSNGKKLLRTIAAGNIILGEPALVHVQVYDNNLVYHRGYNVFSETIKQSDMSNNVEMQLMLFLHNVNQQARAQGLLPDPLTGSVGAMTATEMFDTINRIRACGNADVKLEAIAVRDIYTAGPLQITILVHPVRE